ncbi:MAG: hypothetical protein U0R64_09445 [Candidatus Nanopelagicales bacterium]
MRATIMYHVPNTRTARAAVPGNTWSVGSGSYLTARDFSTIPSSNTVSWSSSTVTMTGTANILSRAERKDVVFTATGSMAGQPAPVSYGLWVRGSNSGSNMSGYVFQIENGSPGRFALQWVNKGNQRPTPLATASFPVGFNPLSENRIVVTVSGNNFSAKVNGATVMTATLPTKDETIGKITYEPASGARYGLRVSGKTRATISAMTAVNAPAGGVVAMRASGAKVETTSATPDQRAKSPASSPAASPSAGEPTATREPSGDSSPSATGAVGTTPTAEESTRPPMSPSSSGLTDRCPSATASESATATTATPSPSTTPRPCSPTP